MEKELFQFPLTKNPLQFAESDEWNEYHEQEQRQNENALHSTRAEIGNTIGEGLSVIEPNCSVFEDLETSQDHILKFLLGWAEKASTRDHLVSLLVEWEEPAPEQLQFPIASLNAMPVIFGAGLQKLAQARMLPAAPRGRPRMKSEVSRQVCEFILDLYGKKAIPLSLCKKRASQKFVLSPRLNESGTRGLKKRWMLRASANRS